MDVHYCYFVNWTIYMDREGMTLVQLLLIALMVIPLIGVITLMILRRSSLRIIRLITISITVLPIFIILILIYEISHADSLDLFTISFHNLSMLSNQQHL